jgi:chorismate mutase
MGETNPAAGMPAELLQLRDSIDNLDAALIHILAERFKCTQRVGEIKASFGLPPQIAGRERPTRSGLRRETAELHHPGSHPPSRGAAPPVGVTPAAAARPSP